MSQCTCGRQRTNFGESVPSSHLYVGAQNPAQVIKLVWPVPLPAEPSQWPLPLFLSKQSPSSCQIPRPNRHRKQEMPPTAVQCYFQNAPPYSHLFSDPLNISLKKILHPPKIGLLKKCVCVYVCGPARTDECMQDPQRPEKALDVLEVELQGNVSL